MFAVFVAALTLNVGVAQAAIGDLIQKPGLAGCISATGSGGACTTGTGMVDATSVVVSPDGRNVYATHEGATSDSVTIFDRDPATGALVQKAGMAGCISQTGAGGCADGNGLSGARSVVVSPDGKNVYVAARFSNAVAVFDRDATTGALTQKVGTAGCISQGGTGGCATGRALSFVTNLVISSDGKNLYAASDPGVAIFDRDSVTGTLTQKSGLAGCVVDTAGEGCTDGRGLASAGEVTLSADGKNLYSAAFIGGIAIFDRDLTTGALTQKAGTAGCISGSGSGGECTDGNDVLEEGPTSVAVSADGTSVYASNSSFDAVVILGRDPVTGALSEKAGAAACISSWPLVVNIFMCTQARALGNANSVTVSPDSRNVYVAALGGGGTGGTGSVVIFDRNTTTGALTQKTGAAGCISDNGTGGCATGSGLQEAIFVRGSEDGRNVYVASRASGAVAIFDRDALPDTTITSGVGEGALTTDRTPTFTFSSTDAGSTFRCQLDFLASFDCASPFTTSTLGPGQHTLSVTAVDPGGAPDPTPVVRTFTVRVVYPLPPAPSPGPSGGGRTITGTGGNDRLVGTAGNDVITCGDGDDVVIAGGGDDVINCGAGNDTIDAGAGSDRVSGGSGNDRIIGGPGNDRLSGDSGNDRITGGTGNDRISGGAGNDTLSGNEGRDVISGGSGNDRISGNESTDRLAGGSGRDRVSGNSGNDRVSGNSGNDRLFGNSGRDSLFGGSGRDVLIGGSGRDKLNGGPGRDRQRQ